MSGHGKRCGCDWSGEAWEKHRTSDGGAKTWRGDCEVGTTRDDQEDFTDQQYAIRIPTARISRSTSTRIPAIWYAPRVSCANFMTLPHLTPDSRQGNDRAGCMVDKRASVRVKSDMMGSVRYAFRGYCTGWLVGICVSEQS